MTSILFLLFFFQYHFLFGQSKGIQNQNNSVFLEEKIETPSSFDPQTNEISLFYYLQGIFIFLFFLFSLYLFFRYLQFKKGKTSYQLPNTFKKIQLDFNKSIYFLKILDSVYIIFVVNQNVQLIDKIPYTDEVNLFLEKMGLSSAIFDDKNSFFFKKIFQYYVNFLKKK